MAVKVATQFHLLVHEGLEAGVIAGGLGAADVTEKDGKTPFLPAPNQCAECGMQGLGMGFGGLGNMRRMSAVTFGL
ncbi:MAG: hypothetical protein AAF772_02765 [Acidobacteriota bacterium]